MKIGVLTLSLYANYGGNLQAYALLTVLKRMGHDVWYINRERHKFPLWLAPLKAIKRAIKKYFFGKDVVVFEQRERAIVAKYSREFISRYIQPQTREFLSTKQLRRGINSIGLDAVVVGSDQVWRRKYIQHNMMDYFLGFLPENAGVRRISYAASFGISNWDYTDSETKICSGLAKRFHAISVREDSAVDLCRKNLGVNAEHVIDPTMLLNADAYIKLINQPEKTFSGVLVYFLDMDFEKQEVIDFVAKSLDLPVFSVNGGPLGEKAQAAPPVEDWLRGFRDASFVVTDSFHGTVFSILFNKPFIACGNIDRGLDRFSSLLGLFDLKDRLVLSPEGLADRFLSAPNWDFVNMKLDLERKRANDFLKSALEF